MTHIELINELRDNAEDAFKLSRQYPNNQVNSALLLGYIYALDSLTQILCSGVSSDKNLAVVLKFQKERLLDFAIKEREDK